MIPYVKLQDLMAKETRNAYTLLDDKNGCVNGCRAGVSIYRQTEYPPASAHEDQEGFFVLEGKGVALVDGDEFEMEPGMAFMVPAGVMHTMKKATDAEFCKVLWFHGAI